MTQIGILGRGDEAALEDVAPGVFDLPVQPALIAQFLADPRLHLAVALDAARIVGFASAVHYVHPDKPAELWINEVGVAPAYQRQGIGKRLIEALFQVGRDLGCAEAWVLTERRNLPAIRLYQSLDGVEPPDEAAMFSFRL
jgi:aminoglycoside 6'-N-acetyltransferase I